jgi:hypothetical protein
MQVGHEAIDQTCGVQVVLLRSSRPGGLAQVRESLQRNLMVHSTNAPVHVFSQAYQHKWVHTLYDTKRTHISYVLPPRTCSC